MLLDLRNLDSVAGGASTGTYYTFRDPDSWGALRMVVQPPPEAFAAGGSLSAYGNRAYEIAQDAARDYFALHGGASIFSEVERRDESGQLQGRYGFGVNAPPDHERPFLDPFYSAIDSLKPQADPLYDEAMERYTDLRQNVDNPAAANDFIQAWTRAEEAYEPLRSLYGALGAARSEPQEGTNGTFEISRDASPVSYESIRDASNNGTWDGAEQMQFPSDAELTGQAGVAM